MSILLWGFLLIAVAIVVGAAVIGSCIEAGLKGLRGYLDVTVRGPMQSDGLTNLPFGGPIEIKFKEPE